MNQARTQEHVVEDLLNYLSSLGEEGPRCNVYVTEETAQGHHEASGDGFSHRFMGKGIEVYGVVVDFGARMPLCFYSELMQRVEEARARLPDTGALGRIWIWSDIVRPGYDRANKHFYEMGLNPHPHGIKFLVTQQTKGGWTQQDAQRTLRNILTKAHQEDKLSMVGKSYTDFIRDIRSIGESVDSIADYPI